MKRRNGGGLKEKIPHSAHKFRAFALRHIFSLACNVAVHGDIREDFGFSSFPFLPLTWCGINPKRLFIVKYINVAIKKEKKIHEYRFFEKTFKKHKTVNINFLCVEFR
jgi:hypothetical protein